MTTMQDVLDLARVDLNDDDKDRWPDTTLLLHANAAIREAYRLRPDFRLGNYATPITDMVVGDVFPLTDEFKRPVADYIIGRASAVDTEHVDTGRVPAYLNLFHDTLLGV